MKSKLTVPFVAACLLGLGFAQAQSTTESTPETVAVTTTTEGGPATYTAPADVKRAKADYKNFAFGIYAGLNSTKLPGESNSSNGNVSGRLGYQAGFFVRGGGRLFGQIGAEYFASSSNYFTAGSGQSVSSIQDQINIQYVQVPVYIGYKLTESDRGISAVRVQLGVEYANRINSNSNSFNLSNGEIKSGSFNGLGQIGLDAGPVFLDLTYHYGFSDAISGTGFNGSARRILSASVGFKF
ncbi:outer membrane beta-barrel protein [Spirosoma rhododendri]|uniref:PorT family protein n=1 Tax=Spirosoma rhododendri TaxID=2728024 RepID=A0A7L5DQ81_9BACT|nr:outer membrane beta-barrel protein [Spirosoma rhododendri]QJD79732.1 PorT family protein [Spirosoma rhododendri]